CAEAASALTMLHGSDNVRQIECWFSHHPPHVHPAKAFRQRIRMTHKERPKTLSVCLTAPQLLPPHPAQAGGNIGGSPIPRGSVSNFDPLGPAPSVEGAHNPVRDESAAARINVLIANLTLVKRVKPLRNDEVQFILGSRHCDIQQPPFFFDL